MANHCPLLVNDLPSVKRKYPYANALRRTISHPAPDILPTSKRARVEGSGTGGVGGVPPPPPEGGVRTGGGGASPPPGGDDPSGNDGMLEPPVGVSPSGVPGTERGMTGATGNSTGGIICDVCTGGRSPQRTWKRFTISWGEKRGRSGSWVDARRVPVGLCVSTAICRCTYFFNRPCCFSTVRTGCDCASFCR